MSLRYKGALLSATPPTVNAEAYGSAKGIWTMQQQFQYEGAGTWPSPFVPSYVEDVFSTYLYTGNGSTQTITNGIDLSNEGGMVWIKSRSNAYAGTIFDTARGIKYGIQTSSTAGQPSITGGNVDLYAYNSDGFSVGADNNFNVNTNTATFASWTFRKAEKFFDVVTYTGTGSARTVSHNLGSTPGCIIVKQTNTSRNWAVYHRSPGATGIMYLNSTAAVNTGIGPWNDTEPTSTQFTVGTSSFTNENGGTYVAYLFAHDAGGFGDAGDQSVIKCGGYTGNGSSVLVDLGWEPQWLLIRESNGAANWHLFDNMRGVTTGGNDTFLYANTTAADNTANDYLSFNATGFTPDGADNAFRQSGVSYIYIAIRRGPMKTPEVGTEVFSPNAYTGTGAGQSYTTGFPVDMTITSRRSPSGANHEVYDRLRPWYSYLFTDTTAAEGTVFGTTNQWLVDRNDGVKWNTGDGYTNNSPDTYCTWNFKRAPGFFDVVCYTGTGTARTVGHNLGVAPELMIVKRRSSVANWPVYSATNGNTKYQYLNTTDAVGTFNMWNDTSPTSSVFSVGSDNDVNGSGSTYVAYLFASCPGVSKVGSYTGNGSSVNVDCGFANGARFVLIKRTDDVGAWWVFDTVRGIVSGNDPYLQLNSTNAENNGFDMIDPYSAGFTAVQASVNTNGATYIYLAIA